MSFSIVAVSAASTATAVLDVDPDGPAVAVLLPRPAMIIRRTEGGRKIILMGQQIDKKSHKIQIGLVLKDEPTQAQA